MNNDEAGHRDRRDTEDRVPVQGTIQSVGIREVLRLALAHAPAHLVLTDPSGAAIELWCREDGFATTEPRTGPEEVLAEALTLRAGTFAVTEGTTPAVEPVPAPDALAAAEALAPLWAEVVAVLPDRRGAVRLRRRAHGPVDVTAAQWRVLAQVGRGRGIGELAQLLRCSERASQRVVAELVAAGLLEVVHAPALLTAPPSGPALAPPSALAAPAPMVAPAASPAPAPLDPAPAAPHAHDEGWEPAAAEARWTPEADEPAVEDSWGDAPVAAPAPAAPAWSWNDEDAADDEGDAGWAAASGPSDGPIEWDPEPELPAGEVRPAPAPVAGFIEDPVDPHDEVLGSTDEELVNRALLFKFLSSVRE